MPSGFGGEERLERRFWIVEADAVVGDLDLMASCRRHGPDWPTSFRATVNRFDRLERVQHEVQDQLLQLNAIGEEQVAGQGPTSSRWRHASRRVAVEQAKHLADDLVDVQPHFSRASA